MTLLFAQAFLRLGARGVTAMRGGLSVLEWVALVVLSAVFVYGEGVRALQRRWVPHALERLEGLPSRPLLNRIFAPFYGMSLVGAPPRILALAWGGVIAIILAVLIVSRFPDPWRGIVDFAVAAALAWASVTLVVGGVRRFSARP